VKVYAPGVDARQAQLETGVQCPCGDRVVEINGTPGAHEKRGAIRRRMVRRTVGGL
jgi:hypothetical protein